MYTWDPYIKQPFSNFRPTGCEDKYLFEEFVVQIGYSMHASKAIPIYKRMKIGFWVGRNRCPQQEKKMIEENGVDMKVLPLLFDLKGIGGFSRLIVTHSISSDMKPVCAVSILINRIVNQKTRKR